MESLKFEWDENKNEVNKKKHGLSFETAQEVFYDEAAVLFDDPDHSIGEERFLIIGMLKSSKICIVSHCYRDSDSVIRLISAREATKNERKKKQSSPRHLSSPQPPPLSRRETASRASTKPPLW